ncbi:hypothetical protein G3T36_18050 [Diaminobutyricibacter tongyongensis]|uniref:Uncharacterized protein n=1 Tax=Leifsonia tongyongensis TaxID=1268043 RepID=A0A6L9Y297_9MICO|nr:hypothetical protein [Diaminobutyricibacter tongyongensis]NEN07763.1 hypothetical protein [Diaminobutyricibacter tongyongensis]
MLLSPVSFGVTLVRIVAGEQWVSSNGAVVVVAGPLTAGRIATNSAIVVIECAAVAFVLAALCLEPSNVVLLGWLIALGWSILSAYAAGVYTVSRQVKSEMKRVRAQVGPGFTVSGLAAKPTGFGGAFELAVVAINSIPEGSVAYLAAVDDRMAYLYRRRGLQSWGTSGRVFLYRRRSSNEPDGDTCQDGDGRARKSMTT